MTDEILNMYLLAPKGYEQLATIVVAPTEEISIKRYTEQENIKELVDMGADVVVVNITEKLAIQGYSVLISKVGMFH